MAERRPGSSGPWRPAPAALVGVGVVVAVVVAAALRLVRLDAAPGGLYPDEAAEGLDAWRLLHVPGFHPLFFDDDGGREPLFAYLVAAVFHVVGPSVTALRATSAVLGVAAVAATPLALRRLGGGAALAGTAWAAGALWLVCVDRDGFRNALVPLAGTLTIAALLALADRPTRGRAILAGAAAGAGLWTYQPLKLVPLLVAVWLVWLARRRSPAWPPLRARLRDGVLAYAAVAAPMAYVAVTDPTGYFGRGLAVSAAGNSAHLGDLPARALWTLVTFAGVTGDGNARHDVAALPLLPVPLALVGALGVLRAWRRRDEPGHALLLAGLPVFVLPALVTLEGDAPHFLRLLGVAPIVAGIVGLGAVELVERAGEWRGSRAATAAGGLIATALAAQAAVTGAAYLGRPVADTYRAYTGEVVALAGLAAADPHAVVVVDDYSGLVVDFLDRDAPPRRAAPGGPRPSLGPADTVYATSVADLEGLLGAGAGAHATVVATDPLGRPAVLALRATSLP